MRTGLIAKKIGMTSIYTEGKNIGVTLLMVEDCEVIAVKVPEKDGYRALQIGFGVAKAKKVNKPQRAIFEKNKMELRSKIKEFRVSEECMVEVGKKISADHFVAGQFIDVSGVTIGKGFAGVMKRWNFRGLEATHGVSITHRSHGSTGQRQDPGRVAKGKKMAGHLGVENVTMQNLKILDVKVDANKGIIVVKGAVPGPKGSYVVVKDAIKKNLPHNVPHPAGFKNNTDNDSTKLDFEAGVN